MKFIRGSELNVFVKSRNQIVKWKPKIVAWQHPDTSKYWAYAKKPKQIKIRPKLIAGYREYDGCVRFVLLVQAKMSIDSLSFE